FLAIQALIREIAEIDCILVNHVGAPSIFMGPGADIIRGFGDGRGLAITIETDDGIASPFVRHLFDPVQIAAVELKLRKVVRGGPRQHLGGYGRWPRTKRLFR
ncbi:MAG TPA: hypothetical protein DD856_09245, partial [Sulfobacillus sp.]|nr:hypothetical protein [Sulfobacillus sp.]